MCYNYFVVAGVVQWLVHGLAKAGMPVRFWSLAPLRVLLTLLCEFYFYKYPISLVDMGFFHIRKED